jgi:iron complex outermembrane receptor protein
MKSSPTARRLSLVALMLVAPVAAPAAPMAIDLPPQPLSTSLREIASARGLTLVVNDDLLASRTGPAIKGNIEPREALNRLLAGSGLLATVTEKSIVVTRRPDEVGIDRISVTAGSLTADQILQSEGSARDGYRVSTLSNVGPLGPKPIQDTPYSFQVQPRELIQNMQSGSPDQMLKANPFAQIYMPTTLNGRPTFNLRGFYNASVAEDGLRNYNGWVGAVEDVERIETMTGLSGFLYGQGNVGGLVNYVSKRPTEAALADVAVGSYGGTSRYIHGDFGGPVGDQRFGYRLNVLSQDGGTAIDNQSVHRSLATMAVDVRPVEQLLVQLDFSHQEYRVDGVPPSWAVATGISHPKAPDASKLWSEKWSYDNVITNKGGVRLNYEANDALTFRTGFVRAVYDQHQLTLTNTIQANGTYTQSLQERPPRTLTTDREFAFVDAKLRTFDIEHKVTMGFFGDQAEWEQSKTSSITTAVPGGFSLSGAVFTNKPGYSLGIQDKYVSNRITNQNLVIGDDIRINDQWQLLIGATDTRIMVKNYGTNGAVSGRYDESEITPSASVVFKPLPWLSTYATYMEALEQGSTAATTYSGKPVTNAGTVMAPVVDTQYEIGVKATVGQALLTMALFEINRASDVYTPNGTTSYTFSEDGRQRHRGVEWGISGKVLDNLTLVGGVTLMEAKITQNPQSPQLVGKAPTNVSEEMAKLYAEYDLPQVPGLTLTGGVYYCGPFYADSANTDKLPGVVVGDVGARYAMAVYGTPVNLRLNVNNVADQNYWMSGSFVGDPRTVVFSAQAKF